MTNPIIADENGDILATSGGAVEAGVDASAPNRIGLNASCQIIYDPARPEATILRWTIATQPDPLAADRVRITLEGTAGGSSVLFQKLAEIVEGTQEIEVDLGVPAGSQAEQFIALFCPQLGDSGPVGEPDGATEVDVDVIDTTPVPVTLVSPPVLTTDPLVEGAQFAYLPGVYTGTPALQTSYEISDDAGGTNAAPVAVTGAQMPAAAAGKYFAVVETVTGDGLETPLVTVSIREPVSAAVTVVPERLLAADMTVLRTEFRPSDQTVWYTPVLQFPGLDGETVTGLRWSTKSGDYPDDAYIEHAVYETTEVPVALQHLLPPDAAPGEYRVFMEDVAKNYPGASPRTDYSVWQDSDSWHSALRFSWQAEAGGAWSPMGDVVTVSRPASVVTPNDGTALTLIISRTQEQADVGEVGGVGLQFFRSYAYTPLHPDQLVGSEDIGWPIISKDWGQWWRPIKGDGLVNGVNGNSIEASRYVSNLLIAVQSSAWRGAIYAEWRAYDGIYRSTDGGDSWAFVQSIPYIPGTSGDVRRKKQLLCECSATEWYYGERLKNGRTEIWRSTNAGVAWTRVFSSSTDPFGAEMYALRYHLGYLWIGARNGLWRAARGASLSPTKITSGFPNTTATDGSIAVREICAHGPNAMLIAYGTRGTWRTTNATSFSLFTNIVPMPTTVQASEVNPNRIVIWGKTGGFPNSGTKVAKVTSNGGASWSNISNERMLGQVEGFSQDLGEDYSGGRWHATREQDMLMFRQQHFGVSSDGCFSTRWSSNNFDWLRANGFAAHPTDWRKMALGLQDRGAMYTKTGWRVGLEDDAAGATKTFLQGTLGLTPQFACGAIVLSPYNDDTAVCGMGNEFKKAPVLLKPATSGTRFWQSSVLDNRTSHCRVGASDPTEPTRGYLGVFRVTFQGGGAASVYHTGKDFCGLHGAITSGTGAGRIYGTDESGQKIYRNDNNGASGSWVLHYTAVRDFRPGDGRARICVDPSVPGRMYWGSSNGRVYRLDGATETEIFNLLDHVSGIPRPEIDTVAIDYFNPQIVYISAAIYGKPVLYRTTDGGATWGTIAGIPQRHGHVWVHPLTSDAIWSSLSGNYVVPPPDGHRDYYAITGSVYDETKVFLEGATV